MKSVDIFCGCGGISAGLKLLGYDIVAGIDIEKKYISTFAENFGEEKAISIDIRTFSASEFMSKFKLETGELDILVGGPPCQGFSKNVPRKYRYLEDPNNLLIKSFLDYCEALLPKMILMENVAEMKAGFHEAYSLEIMNRLESCGYTVTPMVLNAADYGVPQRRRRAFFIANRRGLSFRIPEPTHVKETKNPNNDQLNLLSRNRPNYVSVWDAIGDLPSVKHGEGEVETILNVKPFSDYQKMMRSDSHAVKNHVARKLSPLQYKRVSALKPGQGLKDLPKHLQTKGGYSGAYGRLTKAMIAPTMTRWVFHPGSGRFGHPVDLRTITIREVARIQGFPDTFTFTGSYNDQAGQLGNAVPPLLIYKIVGSMLEQLGLYSPSSISMKLGKDIFSSSVGKLKDVA